MRGTRWLLGVALACACGAPADPPDTGAEWDAMVDTEERLHALRPTWSRLERSLRNLALPDEPSRALFDTTVVVRDLAPGALEASGGAAFGPGLRRRDLAVAEVPDAPRAPSDLALWAPLLARFDALDRASLGVGDAEFVDPAGRRLSVQLHVTLRGRLRSGESASVRGRARLRVVARSDEDWRIAGFETERLELLTAPAPLFREVLDVALPSPEARERARTSRHERLVSDKLRDPKRFVRPHRHFFQGSQDRHPGIAVADVDGNGFDDIYVMARWGPNQLFMNRGDGRFDERAAAWGLDLADHASSAIFGDFDNDGDPDLFLGRTLEPSRYYERPDGRYVDRTREALGDAAPALVSAVSAADVDGDGLLDLYVSTYAAQMVVVERLDLERARKAGVDRPPRLLEAFIGPDDAEALFQRTRQADAHIFRSLPGPPNVLLRNRGEGRFERVEAGPERSFRNTYQAAFADIDADGDPDLYLAHDFAKNQLLRNEGGRFVDVTEETGTADIGFGMGVGFGDYDDDGRIDLYVSNMYSKAGARITARFPELGPDLPKMAQGNTLFRNLGERFERVSGPGRLPVDAAGWSWGGQFGDFDNDGHLDLYVLAGYYPAPPEAALDVDV